MKILRTSIPALVVALAACQSAPPTTTPASPASPQAGATASDAPDSGAGGAAAAWVGGYLSSFSGRSHAKDAFDNWAALMAKKVAALRA